MILIASQRTSILCGGHGRSGSSGAVRRQGARQEGSRALVPVSGGAGRPRAAPSVPAAHQPSMLPTGAPALRLRSFSKTPLRVSLIFYRFQNG